MDSVLAFVRQRRKTKRRSVYSYVGVYHIESQEFLGHLSNRSETGFMVTSIKPFEPQQTYQLAMHFLCHNENELRPVEARCLWIRRQGDSFFNAGFQITEPEISTLAAL